MSRPRRQIRAHEPFYDWQTLTKSGTISSTNNTTTVAPYSCRSPLLLLPTTVAPHYCCSLPHSIYTCCPVRSEPRRFMASSFCRFFSSTPFSGDTAGALIITRAVSSCSFRLDAKSTSYELEFL